MVEYPASRRAIEALTPRENDVLRMIGLGLTNAQVAERLGVTVHAVKFHLGHVYRKLGVSNRTEAAVLFQELGQNGTLEPESPVDEWNATQSAFPACCLHELIEESAARRPEAVAVADGYGATLTYAELDRRANQLAQHLRGLGVGPEVLVGIAVTRSAELVVGLLGILKAGGAYVPIDPNYPAERVEYMLVDANAPVLVTEQQLLPRLPPSDAHIVCLDRDWGAIEASVADRPAERAGPENLAYVIYTSGSTGNPKGVEIPHRALVNFVTTMRERPGLTEDDVLLAVTTLSFDIAGLELYVPLVTGARVVIAPEAATSNPAELARMLDDFGVTVMQATPTTWRMLVDAGWPGRPLKALCGGEALPLALADALVERGLELWNMYGPTETTIWSTTRPLTVLGESPTIGRPIANTTLHVLDEELRAVEIGTPGELHIGGAGLARGYRGRPDLTNERFLPDPFADGPEARIYKTGDLVRYREDGDVEYLGRLDHQVKIRGFRIELGEIETVLARHASVSEAVAVAREDTPGDPRIVAYVRQPAIEASSAELREHVGTSLPPYMVPSAIVTLEHLPLTPNGKVDRKALPAPVYARSEEREYVAPTTRTEKQLAKIWQQELHVDRVGIHDDFFDLGATSIAAAHVIARIQRTLAKDVALTPIFEARTIEQLAKLIDSGEVDRRWTSLVPMQTTGPREPIFCVHGGAGTIVHLDPLARRLADERPFYGLQSRGLYGGDPPLQSVEEMATHYLAELRSVQPHGPYYLAGYCFGTIAAFEMAQQLVADGEEVALLAMFNGPSPSWIKEWGTFSNQPRQREARRAAATTRSASRGAKVARVLRDPERLRAWISWGGVLARRRVTNAVEGPRVRWSLEHGRPLPEWLRESYFLKLHANAERTYDPQPYAGEIAMFSGAGMYDDLTLGWDGLAEQGIRTYVVPGDHKDNRDMMRPHNVGFVADMLIRYCDENDAAHPDQPVAATAS